MASPTATSIFAALYTLAGHVMHLINSSVEQHWVNGVFLSELMGVLTQTSEQTLVLFGVFHQIQQHQVTQQLQQHCLASFFCTSSAQSTFVPLFSIFATRTHSCGYSRAK